MNKFVPAADRLLFIADHLINHRLVLHKEIIADANGKVSIGVDLGLVDALERHLNRVGVGAGRDDKIVFQFVLISVIDQIDAVIDLAVTHAAVVGDVGAVFSGIVANEIVGVRAGFALAGDGGVVRVH